MINLDTEEEGQLYIGCAGGKLTKGTIPITTEEAPAGWVKCVLTVSGLKGGHSGLNIHEEHANAIKVLVSAIGLLKVGVGAKLAYISGGDKHNAIPREAEAHVFIPKNSFRTDLMCQIYRYEKRNNGSRF